MCITRLWQEMHNAMLDEFDRDTPKSPVSKYLNENLSVYDLLVKGVLDDDDLELGRLASKPHCAKERFDKALQNQGIVDN